MNNQVLGFATQVMIMAIVVSIILLFMGIGVLILIHICIVGRAFRRGFRGDNNTIERGSFGSTSMSQDDIEKLPSFDFKAREKGSSPVDCAVCLENFKAGDKCRLLPLCRHSFHAECVDLWLQKTPVCPICRTGADSWRSGPDSGRFNETRIELRESRSAEGVEGSRLSDSAVEARQSRSIEETHLSEPRENQANLAGADPSLNATV
ncbi:hypothetical protein NMG60_11006612 [Bertholletia excelsa]